MCYEIRMNGLKRNVLTQIIKYLNSLNVRFEKIRGLQVLYSIRNGKTSPSLSISVNIKPNYRLLPVSGKVYYNGPRYQF